MSKLAIVFRTSWRRQRRDRVGLALTLLTAPGLLLLYWALLGDSASVELALLAREPAGGRGARIVERLRQLRDGRDRPLLRLRRVGDEERLVRSLQRGEVAAALVLPAGLDRALAAGRPAPPLQLRGDASAPAYLRAATAIRLALGAEARRLAATPPLLQLAERPLPGSAGRRPFEVFVPGLLVFSVIMLVFSASIAVAREVEAGTMVRLQLTAARPAELLGGISAVQLLVGVVSVGLTLGLAIALGFRSQGPLWLVLTLGAVACLASIGLGMVVASVARTTFRAFLVASVAMFLLMLFSGVIFARPRLALLDLGGRAVGPLELLPTTHLGEALGKVLVRGAGLADVLFELVALATLSALFFVVGAALFRRVGARAAGGVL